jgi:hypothetical protein
MLDSRNCRGASSGKALVLFVGVGALIFVAAKLASNYFEHQSMLAILKDAATRDLVRPGEPLASTVVAAVRAADEEFSEADLKLDYTPSRDAVTVAFPYRRPVDFMVARFAVPWSAEFTVHRPAIAATVNNVKISVENSLNQGAAQREKELFKAAE